MIKKKIEKMGLISMISILVFSQMNLSVLAVTDTSEMEVETQLEISEDKEQADAVESPVENTPIEEKKIDKISEDAVVDAIGFSVESKLDKQSIDLDAKDKQLKVIYNMKQLDPASKLYNGELVIDLSGTNLVLVENSYPTTSTAIKSVTYSKSEKKLKVVFKDNINGTFDFPFLVEPSVTAKAGDQYQIKATMNGTNLDGQAYTEVKSETETISITGTNKDYIEADAESIKKWKLNSNFSAIFGYPGQYLNQYATSGPGPELHFTNLIIKKERNGSKSWETRDGMSAVTTGNRGDIIQDDEETLIAKFGEQNLTKLFLHDRVNIPKDTAAGVYEMVYHIYNEDVYLFTMTKKTTVLQAGTIVSYLANVTGNTEIGEQDKFNWKYMIKATGGPDIPKDVALTLKIPAGVKLLTLGLPSGTNVKKLEYEQEDSGEWQVVPQNTVDFSAMENVTRVRISAVDAMLTPASYGNIKLQNLSVPAGEELHLITESLQYTDTFGEQHDLVKETTNATFDLKVSVVEASNNAGAAQVSTAVTPLSSRQEFPTLPIYNGFTFYEAVKIGARQGGELKQPYVFVILPEGFSRTAFPYNYIGTNMLSGVNILDTRLPNYSNPSSPGKGEAETKTLSDGRTIHYIKAPESVLQGTKTHLEYLLGGFTIQTKNAKSGQYNIEYGAGSLVEDDYEVVDANGMEKEALPTEIKEILGADASSYLTTSKSITVGSLNGISTESAIKGSEDKKFVDGTTVVASSMPGRAVDYRYTIKNNGTQAITDFEMIDILPYLDDTFITNDQPRGSKYEVNATDSIQVLVNGEQVGATLEYSTSSKPKRFDLAGEDVSGDSWSTTKPSDITSIKAIRVALTQPLEPGDTVVFSYSALLPIDAPRNGETANNTIAYRGNIRNSQDEIIEATALELSNTSVAAVAPVNDGALSGNLFMDLNKNGQQEQDEPGYNNVKVDVFKANDLKKAVASTTTAPSGLLQGTYSFIDLPYAQYKIRVTLPKNATFIEEGVAGLEIDAANPEYAWIKKDGKTTFTLSDVSGVGTKTIEGLNGAIHRATPLNGKVVFVDKHGNVVEGAKYGADYEVSLKDTTGKEIATTKADDEGNYEFLNLDIPSKADYQLVFTAPSGKSFVFAPKNADPTGKIAITLTPGRGIASGSISDIYITDTDKPSGTIVFEEGAGENHTSNPTKATITGKDETTRPTVSWAIKDLSGKTYYAGTGATITQQLGYLIADKKDGQYVLEAHISDTALNMTIISETFYVITSNPEIMVDKENHVLEYGATELTKADFLTIYGITAKDKLDHDLPESAITIDDTAVDYSKLGAYPVQITVEDTAGNEATKEITLSIVDTQAPIVSADTNPILLNTKEAMYQNLTEASLYEMAKLKAVDGFDGTENAWEADKITFTSDFNKEQLAPSKTGQTHTVNVTATDSNGNSSTVFALTIIVTDNTAPTFNTENQTYSLGDTVTEEQFKEQAISELKDDYTQLADLNVTTNFAQVDFGTTGTYTVDVTISDVAGNSTTKKVTVKITAAPLIQAKEQLQYEVKSSKEEADFIRDAEVVVTTSPAGENVNITTDFAQQVNLNKVGEYSVTITAETDDQLSATKKVTVKVVDSTKPVISDKVASHTAYPLAQSVDAAKWLKDSSFSATDNYTEANQLVIQHDFETAVDFSTPGTYTITMTATDEAGNVSEAKAVQVVVLPAGYVVPNPTHSEAIKASNFIAKEQELEGLSTAQMIEKGQASAIKADGSNTPVPVTKATFKTPSKVGPNIVTYATDNKQTTYQAYAVASNKQFVQLANGFAVAMNKGIISTSSYQSLSKEEKLNFFKVDKWLLPNLNQFSFVKRGQELFLTRGLGDLIEIDDSAVKEDKPGTYPVVMKFDDGHGGTFEMTTYVIIINEGAHVSDDAHAEIVMGNDFKVELEEVATLTDNIVKEKSAADAWNQVQIESDGYNTRVAFDIDKSQVLPQIGTYPVTLKSANSETLTIYVTVFDGTIPDPQELMGANNVTLQDTEVASLTEEKMIELANAHAWLDDGQNTAVPITKVDFQSVVPVAGSYTATFETDKGTNISIDVTVLEAEGDWKIKAQDIEFTVAEIKEYKANGTLEQEVLTRSDVKAWDSKTGEILAPIEVDLRQLAVLNEAGNYEVGFSYVPTGTSKNNVQTQINVLVINDEKNTNQRLPLTGEQTMNYLWVGLSLVIISGFSYYQKRKVK